MAADSKSTIADFAAVAPWRFVFGKPSVFPAEPHRHDTSDFLRSGATNNQTIGWDASTNQFIPWNQPVGARGASGLPGAQGASGAQGSSGAQGPQGNQGSAGAGGPGGPSGFPGATGARGSQGPTGFAGGQGAQGDQGGQGSQGSQGNQGSQGPAGVQGPEGEQGGSGDQGDQGSCEACCDTYISCYIAESFNPDNFDDGYNDGETEYSLHGCQPCPYADLTPPSCFSG